MVHMTEKGQKEKVERKHFLLHGKFKDNIYIRSAGHGGCFMWSQGTVVQAKQVTRIVSLP